jgi:Ca-activated chloride channel family protein
MELAARLNRPYVSTNGGVVYGELDIEPGDHGYGKQSNRQLAICIDKSGSMNFDEKLKNAKAGARAVLGRLESDDEIGIYAFDDDAETVVPLQRWGDLDRNEVEDNIDTVHVGSSTNIEAGLLESRDALRGASNGEAVQRILLLSDGNPNTGITSVEDFRELATQLGGEGISVISAGLGTDYNEDIVREIGEASQGEWDHLTSASEIKQFFVDAAYDAGQTVLGNPEIYLELATGVEIGEVYRRMPQIQKVETDATGNEMVIPMPDLENREKQELVFQVDVPGGSADDSLTVADVSLRAGGSPVATGELAVTYSHEPAQYGEEEAIRAKFVHAKGINAGLEGDTNLGTRLIEGVGDTFTDPLAQRILQVGKTDVSKMANASSRSERLESMQEGSNTGEIEKDQKFFGSA